MLLCVSSGSNKDTPNRFQFDGNGYYLKSPEEMRTLFAELPEACDNTLAIAERCNTSFTEGSGTFMPKFDGAGGGDRVELVRQGGRPRAAGALPRRRARVRRHRRPPSRRR